MAVFRTFSVKSAVAVFESSAPRRAMWRVASTDIFAPATDFLGFNGYVFYSTGVKLCGIQFIGVRFLVVGLAVGLLVGCGNGRDQREARHPLLKRAIEMKEKQRIDEAIALCQKALERKPHLAKAHLELALLYDTYLQDYMRAVYHYSRYLELNPDTEKRDLIEDSIRHSQLLYAIHFPEAPEALRTEIIARDNRIRLLQEDNERLRQENVRLLTGEDVAPASPREVPPPSLLLPAPPPINSERYPLPPPVTPAPPAPSIDAPPREYSVQSGDTLSTIASKFYGDPRLWEALYAANSNRMANPRNLRVGQVLIIPEKQTLQHR